MRNEHPWPNVNIISIVSGYVVISLKQLLINAYLVDVHFFVHSLSEATYKTNNQVDKLDR